MLQPVLLLVVWSKKIHQYLHFVLYDCIFWINPFGKPHFFVFGSEHFLGFDKNPHHIAAISDARSIIPIELVMFHPQVWLQLVAW